MKRDYSWWFSFFFHLNWIICLVTISCDISLTPKQVVETYKLRHVPKQAFIYTYYVYKSMLHLCPYFRAIHHNWNIESTIYSQCSNPRRSSSTRKKRSIDENREVIKLRTTQTIADPRQQSSFMKNVLSIFTILALFYWTKLFFVTSEELIACPIYNAVLWNQFVYSYYWQI